MVTKKKKARKCEIKMKREMKNNEKINIKKVKNKNVQGLKKCRFNDYCV